MKNYFILLAIICGLSPMIGYAQSDGLPRGAFQMPYTRYEATAASLGGGATLLGPTFDQTLVQSEATDRICASLNTLNSFVKWNLTAPGQGLVLRFSIPDAAAGGGQSGSLTLYINGVAQTINLTSKWAWQYFNVPPTNGKPTNTPIAAGLKRMRFDEVRVKLASSVAAGVEIKLQKTTASTINYIVDFIEMEPVPAAIANPGFVSVVTHGATPNDATDDLAAFNAAITSAKASGQHIYIPAGRFLLSQKLNLLNVSNMTIQGAGQWHTEIYFSSASSGRGGIEAGGINMHLKDFYISGENTTRQEYKGIMGGYGTGSSIERMWVEHCETGAWIANFNGPANARTNGLLVTGCRFRNNYADGINFSKATSNSICEHSDMRNNGDDAMATWSSPDDALSCLNNEFRFCTAENTWRAAGLGFFGGGGHRGHHLLIKDGTEVGLRVNSDFPSPSGFATTLWMEMSEITVIGCGTNKNVFLNRYGAIDIFTRLYNIQNLRFRNVDVLKSQKDAVMIYNVAPATPKSTITNLEFINVNIDGTGADNNVNNNAAVTYDDYLGYGIYVLGKINDWTNGSMFNQSIITNAATAAIRNESAVPIAATTTFVMNGNCLTPINLTSVAPVIDTNLDAVWSRASVLPLNNAAIGQKPADFTGSRWRTFYDNTNLYVLVEVKDANRFNDSGTSWWDDDAVEIYLDGNNSKLTAYDGVDDLHYVFRYNDATLKLGLNSANKTAGISFAQHNVANGYNIEVKIPWTTIGATPSSGKKIGIDVAVDDDDNGGVRDAQMFAFATTNTAFSNPSIFGTGTLCTSLPSTVLPIVTNTSLPDGNVGLAYNTAITAGNDPTTYSATGLPPGVSVNQYTGAITGVPTRPGTFNVRLIATNSAGSGQKLLPLIVREGAGTVSCLRTPTSITMDGLLTELGWNTTVFKPVMKGTIGTINNTSLFTVLWDNTNLYVGVRVNDASIFTDSPNTWDDDAVEVYIDANNNALATYDGLDNQIVRSRTTLSTKLPITGLQHASALVTGGYSVELAIPWSQLGIAAPVNGTILGFDVGYDDDDNGGTRDTQGVWTGTANNFTNTSGFGKLVLCGAVPGSPLRSIAEEETVFEERLEEDVMYWPTLVENELNIQTDGSYKTLEVVDLMGRSHIRQSIEGKSDILVNVENLSGGVHVVRMKGMMKNTTFKIIRK